MQSYRAANRGLLPSQCDYIQVYTLSDLSHAVVLSSKAPLRSLHNTAYRRAQLPSAAPPSGPAADLKQAASAAYQGLPPPKRGKRP